LKIHYISGRCGSGKTYQTIKEIVSKPQRTVLAVDRVEAIKETINFIKEISKEVGSDPTIDAVHAEKIDFETGYEVRGVLQAIEQKGKELSSLNHVIFIVTHRGLVCADWSNFKDWAMVIDEAPSIIEHGTFNSPVTKSLFKQWYDLEISPIDGWAKVRLAKDAPTIMDVKNDVFLQKFVEFHEYVTNRLDVYVNLIDWEFEDSDSYEWIWLKIWNPESLAVFNSVLILANDFRDTLTHKIISNHYCNIQLIEENLATKRTSQSKNVEIQYFVDEHRSSTHFWVGKSGRECVQKLTNWISLNTSHDHIITCNHAIRKNFEKSPGHLLSPRQHGSNKWSHVNQCSIIYSNKPDKNQKEVFNFFKISEIEATRAHEGEDIIQFCFRTSLRNPNDSSDVTIRVYDKSQADFLADYLNSLGYINASTKLISEVGISQIVRKRGRPQKNVTNAQKSVAQKNYKAQNAKAQQKKRQEEKEKKIRDGSYQGPGRPRKNPIIVNTIQ